jgi:hypothetical protein
LAHLGLVIPSMNARALVVWCVDPPNTAAFSTRLPDAISISANRARMYIGRDSRVRIIFAPASHKQKYRQSVPV